MVAEEVSSGKKTFADTITPIFGIEVTKMVCSAKWQLREKGAGEISKSIGSILSKSDENLSPALLALNELIKDKVYQVKIKSLDIFDVFIDTITRNKSLNIKSDS
jgi:hypothetical protein